MNIVCRHKNLLLLFQNRSATLLRKLRNICSTSMVFLNLLPTSSPHLCYLEFRLPVSEDDARMMRGGCEEDAVKI